MEQRPGQDVATPPSGGAAAAPDPAGSDKPSARSANESATGDNGGGGGQGAALSSALADVISPNEDVRKYLQATLLPVLGPALEKLLHHVHDSGELQEALRSLEGGQSGKGSRAAKRGGDDKAQPEKAPTPSGKDEKDEKAGAAAATAGTPAQEGAPAVSPSPAPGSDGGAGAAAEPGGSAGTESIVPAFDSLVWLSDHLRQFSTGPMHLYREHFEARVADIVRRQQEEAEEAEADEEEGDEEGRPMVFTGEGDLPTVTEEAKTPTATESP